MRALESPWPGSKLKRLLRPREEDPRPGDGIVTAFRNGQVTLRSARRVEGFTEAVKETGYQRVQQGDLVIHSMDAFAGAIGVAEATGKCSPVYQVLEGEEHIDVRYIAYCLREAARSGFIQSLARGIRERSTDFRWSQARDVIVPCPPPETQRLIVEFLNRENARIDDIRTGLDQYQSEVQKGWIATFERETANAANRKRLKYFGCSLKLGPFGTLLRAEEYISGGVPVINPIHIRWRGLAPDQDVTISEERAHELAHYRLEPDDVVLARRGELGRAAVIQPHQAGFICGTGSARIRVDRVRLAPSFLVLLLLTEWARSNLMLHAVGATMANLNSEALMNLSVPNWSLENQKQAVDAATAAYESTAGLLAELKTAQGILGEYRNALIAETVTGRLDVSTLTESQMEESLAAVREGEKPEVLT